MGLLLQNLTVPLDDSKNERAAIFLTNSLTGWDFAGENPKLANWPELEAERVGCGQGETGKADPCDPWQSTLQRFRRCQPGKRSKDYLTHTRKGGMKDMGDYEE